MKLKLKKPIIFFDLETSGTDFKNDAIIEIYAKKFYENNTTEEIHHLLNPVVSIHPQATEKHGYTNEMLKDKPRFSDIADEVYEFFKDCDLGGYNLVKFDIPFLFEEFYKCGLIFNAFQVNVIDPFKILFSVEPRTLEAYYERVFGEKFENAHTASADVDACIKIFEYQVDKYNLGDSASEINKLVRYDKNGNKMLDFYGIFIVKEDGNCYYTKGKYIGKTVQTDKDYLLWIIKNSKYETNVKHVANLLYKKYFKE